MPSSMIDSSDGSGTLAELHTWPPSAPVPLPLTTQPLHVWLMPWMCATEYQPDCL